MDRDVQNGIKEFLDGEKQKKLEEADSVNLKEEVFKPFKKKRDKLLKRIINSPFKRYFFGLFGSLFLLVVIGTLVIYVNDLKESLGFGEDSVQIELININNKLHIENIELRKQVDILTKEKEMKICYPNFE